MSEWNDDDRVILTEGEPTPGEPTPEVVTGTSRRMITHTFRLTMTKGEAGTYVRANDGGKCQCEACRDNVV